VVEVCGECTRAIAAPHWVVSGESPQAAVRQWKGSRKVTLALARCQSTHIPAGQPNGDAGINTQDLKHVLWAMRPLPDFSWILAKGSNKVVRILQQGESNLFPDFVKIGFPVGLVKILACQGRGNAQRAAEGAGRRGGRRRERSTGA